MLALWIDESYRAIAPKRLVALMPEEKAAPRARKAMPKADFSKWPKPEEIARVILFLCSDDS